MPATIIAMQSKNDGTDSPAPRQDGTGAAPLRMMKQRKRVVIVGAGVAGLTAAFELRHQLGDYIEILVVSNTEQFMLGQALLGLVHGRQAADLGFAIPPVLARHGIGFRRASVDKVDPRARLVRAGGEDIGYDYLLIATGPAVDGLTVPGVGGQFNASYSIHSESSAMVTHVALDAFLAKPGVAVVGLAPGASYTSAAYEFALWLDYSLRLRGTRDQASITFVTPESQFGHLGVGIPSARRLLERRFAKRNITILSGQNIRRVDREHVYLRDGTILPSDFTMVIPAFHGVPDIWKSSGLTDDRGFVPVDAEYRHRAFPEIFAAGVAAQADVAAPIRGGLPKTGYLSSAMAKTAARNVAASIQRSLPRERSLPRLLDLRVIDGGDTGIILFSAGTSHPVQVALPLPGRTAHRLKGLINRFVLWRLRTGHI